MHIEAEVAAPYKLLLDEALARERDARSALAGLERIMRSDLAPKIMDYVAHEMGRGFYTEIMKALSSIGAVTGTTTITVPTGMLLGADRDSIVARVIDWWKSETAPRMSFRAFKGEQEIQESVTVLDVRVPELRYRHRVADSVF